MSALTKMQRALAKENAKYTSTLERVPYAEWPPFQNHMPMPIAVWRSADFLVQRYTGPSGSRISVNRCRLAGLTPNGAPLWADGISWDDLMEIKRQIGCANHWAVEIFPPDADIVNVANMRHLWLIDEPPYGWKRKR